MAKLEKSLARAKKQAEKVAAAAKAEPKPGGIAVCDRPSSLDVSES